MKKNNYFDQRDYDFYNPKPYLLKLYALLNQTEKERLWAWRDQKRYNYINKDDLSNISLRGPADQEPEQLRHDRDDYESIRDSIESILWDRRDCVAVFDQPKAEELPF